MFSHCSFREEAFLISTNQKQVLEYL